MTEMEEEEHNFNNVTMDTFCQSPVKTNTQIKNKKIPNEKQIAQKILIETLNRFKN